MSAQNINPSMLVDIVNSHYANIKADWRVPPALVLESAIQGVCLADINKARAEIGLDTWERKMEQISKDAP